MKQLFREPLVHFLVLGFLVFFTDYARTGGQDSDERTIIVSQSVLARLDDTWLRTTGSQPSKEDRDGLIAQYVQDEALVREARKTGLDDGDEIIKRRLAQKMRFIASGAVEVEEPSEKELENWFSENREWFDIGERRSFNLVYFSPERHKDKLADEANSALGKLKKGADWKSLGDPFMQKRTYVTVPEGEVARSFGPEFAKAIFDLPEDQWSDPIGSAFGLHLVRIEAVDRAAKADFTANRARILVAFMESQSQAGSQREIEKIVAQYNVVIDEPGPTTR